MHAEHEQETVDEIGRVNRLYAVLSKVNEAIVRIREPQELYESACRIAVEDAPRVDRIRGARHPVHPPGREVRSR